MNQTVPRQRGNVKPPPCERLRSLKAPGQLTPKMSVKRKVVEQRHREILDGFYKDTVARL